MSDVPFLLVLAGVVAALLLVLLLAYVFVRSRLGHYERRIK
jgi:hypothetical protein